jgi:predicted GTPase
MIISLEEWFDKRAKPFLEQYEAIKAAELAQDLDRLRGIDRRTLEDLPVCFLGASGVGKSTLINALVAGHESVLPSGGIGPLTALAMEVRHGHEARFEVEYQSPQNLWPLVFGLEQTLRRKQGVQPAGESEAVAEGAIREEELAELQLSDEAAENRFERSRRQALKLITDDQNGDTPLPYLLDRLRELCGQRPIWGTATTPTDEARMQRLMSVLAAAKEGRSYKCAEKADRSTFLRELAVHATGFLAPIIRKISIFWNSALLQPSLTLIDLPGVGVAGDVYKEVTRRWIVEKARAVVLVVDNRGVRESDAELLRRSDFLTRLLFSVDDPMADPVILVAAVTQLDSSAEDRYFQSQTKKKREHLADVFLETIELVKKQMRQELLSVWTKDGQPPRAGQAKVIDHLISNLRVFPVSAFEFRRLMKKDPDDPAFITDASQSGVPQMQVGLNEIARAWRESAEQQRAEAAKAFVDRVLTTLEVVQARWQQGGQADDEVEDLRRELESLIAPMRDEFLIRKGEFRGFLRNEIPKRIEALVSDAAQVARRDIKRYLQGLSDARWNTLKAAVTRDGVFRGARYINLPDDLSQKFVEPVAEIWGTKLLQEIRSRTRLFTKDCVSQLDILVEWCRAQGTRVQPKLLEKHVASIKADVEQVNLVGKEVIADLRENVKNRLKNAIEKPVTRRCREFVRKGDAEGDGVSGAS